MKILSALLLLFTCCGVSAQDSIPYYNHKRYEITATGMKVLGGWGLANLGAGAAGWAGSQGQTKYFYQMNTFWGAINAGAAILGYTGAQHDKGRSLTAAQSLKEQQKIERIFLVNGGLDVAYIAAGIFVNHRGNVKNNDKLKGYGPAVILQGAFLFFFDGTMYATHRSNGNKLKNFLLKNPVTFNGKNVGMLIRL